MPSPGTPGTPPTSRTPSPRSGPTRSASTTCSAMSPNGSLFPMAPPWYAGDRGPTPWRAWDPVPEPRRRPPGTKLIRSFPRAAGGSPTHRSSAFASYSSRHETVMTPKHPRDVTRRAFVETTAAATAALALPPQAPSIARGAPKTLRIALIGCGGRGTGAAKDCLTSSENVELVAPGDLFPDHLTRCRENPATMATEDPTLKPQIKGAESQLLTGFAPDPQLIEIN